MLWMPPTEVAREDGKVCVSPASRHCSLSECHFRFGYGATNRAEDEWQSDKGVKNKLSWERKTECWSHWLAILFYVGRISLDKDCMNSVPSTPPPKPSHTVSFWECQPSCLSPTAVNCPPPPFYNLHPHVLSLSSHPREHSSLPLVLKSCRQVRKMDAG